MLAALPDFRLWPHVTVAGRRTGEMEGAPLTQHQEALAGVRGMDRTWGRAKRHVLRGLNLDLPFARSVFSNKRLSLFELHL